MRSVMAFACLLTASLLGASGPLHADELEQAFERERTLLIAEKEELQQELERLRARGEERRRAAQTQLASLSESLTALRLQVEELEERIQGKESQIETRSSHQDLLEATFEQALDTLHRQGVDLDVSDLEEPAIIERIFDAGLQLVGEQASMRVAEGVFFDAQGKKHQGSIFHVGAVAALGSSPQAGGVLGPAIRGYLRVVAPETRQQARAVLEGQPPARVRLYLFDPLDRQKEVPDERTLWAFIQSGGFIVWPILGLGLLAMLIVLERLFTLQRVHTNAQRLTSQVIDIAREGRWHDAAALCKQRSGAISRVLKAALQNRHLERQLFDDSVSEAILNELPTLERFLSMLHVIAAVTPLLGLLGTVTGMISTFEVITEHGTGDPKLLSGGISEALITTELGLMVAIPVLLLHALLSGRVDHIVGDMETQTLRLNNAMHQKQCVGLGLRDHDEEHAESSCPELSKNASGSWGATGLASRAEPRADESPEDGASAAALAMEKS